MKLHKRLVKNRFVKQAVTFLLTRFIRFVFLTNRWTMLGAEHLRPYTEEGQQAIFVFWHGRLMMMPNFAPKNPKLYAIVSIHGDGEVFANCMRFFNTHLVRGSSRKGGANALRRAKDILVNEKQSICLTPDGPRGPCMRNNSQVIALAKMSSAPIIPLTFSCTHAKQLKSWDKFLLALPFGRAVLICGTPLSVPPDCDTATMETLKTALEHTLNRMTQEADAWAGRGRL